MSILLASINARIKVSI